MSKTRRTISGEQEAARAAAREVRELVADQLHDLVVERDSLGSDSELIASVRYIGAVGRQLAEAEGRERQALEVGLPVTPAVTAQREARELLRAAVMSLAVTCGSWVVAMDFDQRRVLLEAAARNGKPSRRPAEENI